MDVDGGYLVARAQALLVRATPGASLVRRSSQLRAALGARPLTAAAAVTLAGELPPGSEADQLRETALLTATELQLTWLLRGLSGSAPASLPAPGPGVR